jgi:competence protein ComFC
MLNIIKKLYYISEQIIWPSFCYQCLNFTTQGYLCSQCLKNTNFDLLLLCPRCQRRKPIYENLNETCCSNSIKTLINFADYQNSTIKKLIIDGKFNGYWKIFDWLAYIISEKIKILKLKNLALTYVPLTEKVKKQRGFNQTEILAKKISYQLNLPLFRGIIKIKETEFQSHLNYQQRLTNLKDCFTITSTPPQNILIVDDIMTTGATLFEIAQVLKSAGSKNLCALTICR